MKFLSVEATATNRELNLDVRSPDQHFLDQDSVTEQQSQGPPVETEAPFGDTARKSWLHIVAEASGSWLW